MAQNGFRSQAEPSRKERERQLATELKNMQAAMRITQMMVQQMMQNTKNIQVDMGKAFNMINELQYKQLATETVGALDSEAIADKANGLRLVDFNESSDKEDTLMSYTVGDVVKEDSVVILTSVAEDPEKSIFRSKVGLKEANVPDLTKGLLGREVGAKVALDIAGCKHTVELLGIRYPAPPVVKDIPAVAVPTQVPVDVETGGVNSDTGAAEAAVNVEATSETAAH